MLQNIENDEKLLQNNIRIILQSLTKSILKINSITIEYNSYEKKNEKKL